MSIYDHCPIDESINAPTINEYEFSTYPSFVSSTAHSPRSQLSTSVTQQKFNQSISTRMHTGLNNKNS
jgi:hypothetical protein